MNSTCTPRARSRGATRRARPDAAGGAPSGGAERARVERAASARFDGRFHRFAQALTVAVDMAAKAFQRDGKLSGIATGLRDLDIKMGGLQPSDLIIVAGRPGMGKTALATNIASNVAKAHRAEVQADGSMKSGTAGTLGVSSRERSPEPPAPRLHPCPTTIAARPPPRGRRLPPPRTPPGPDPAHENQRACHRGQHRQRP